MKLSSPFTIFALLCIFLLFYLPNIDQLIQEDENPTVESNWCLD